MENKKPLLVKILVPVLILAIIGSMWLVKNNSADKEVDETLFALELTAAVDFDLLSEHGLPAIIDYGSDSCIPCKEMAPALKMMNEEMKGKAFIKFADVWAYPDAANNVPIQVIPTQVLVNADGTPFVPSEELASRIEFLMYSHRETGEHVFTVHQGGLTEEQMRLILKEMGVE